MSVSRATFPLDSGAMTNFFFNRVIFDGPVRNPEQLGVQHQGLSDGHARRNRNAAFDFHASQKFAATDETRMEHG